MLSTIDDSTLTKVAMALGAEEAVQLIAHLKGVEEITDDEIANKTGIRLNSVRKILYKLYDHSLVSLEKNTGPKNWMVYFSLETSTRSTRRFHFKPETTSFRKT